MLLLDGAHVAEQLVGGLHRHTTEVRHQMRTVGVAGDAALRASSSVLATKGEHVAAVAAPVCADVVDGLETVGDAVVDLLFVLL